MRRVIIHGDRGHEHQMLANQFFQANMRELARHLPPSGATLRLIDLECGPASISRELLALRPDLHIVALDTSLEMLGWAQIALRSVAHDNPTRLLQSEPHRLPFADNTADAIVAHTIHYLSAAQKDSGFLNEVQRVLRPGGRLIIFDGSFSIEPATPKSVAQALDTAGFARVLGERGVGGYGVLVRGEKPHPTQILAHPTASAETALNGLSPINAVQLAQTPGRYIFLLIRQTPNEAAWSLQPWARIAWDAASALDQQSRAQIALAFSSLPKAVAFMQPAVTANVLVGVTRIAKFDKAIAARWSFPVLLNPPFEPLRSLDRYDLPGPWLPIDPADARTGDE